MTDHRRLQESIHIYLTTAPESSKRGLAGTGRSHRREKSSAASVARDVLRGVRINHRIEQNGAAVDDIEVIDLLAAELWELPEALLKDLVGIDSNKRDDARRAITQTLLAALTSRFELTYFIPRYQGMGPSDYQSWH